MSETTDLTIHEIKDLNEKCNSCRYGRWQKGEFLIRKICTTGLDPETCDHDLDKFEDEK